MYFESKSNAMAKVSSTDEASVGFNSALQRMRRVDLERMQAHYMRSDTCATVSVCNLNECLLNNLALLCVNSAILLPAASVLELAVPSVIVHLSNSCQLELAHSLALLSESWSTARPQAAQTSCVHSYLCF